MPTTQINAVVADYAGAFAPAPMEELVLEYLNRTYTEAQIEAAASAVEALYEVPVPTFTECWNSVPVNIHSKARMIYQRGEYRYEYMLQFGQSESSIDKAATAWNVHPAAVMLLLASPRCRRTNRDYHHTLTYIPAGATHQAGVADVVQDNVAPAMREWLDHIAWRVEEMFLVSAWMDDVNKRCPLRADVTKQMRRENWQVNPASAIMARMHPMWAEKKWQYGHWVSDRAFEQFRPPYHLGLIIKNMLNAICISLNTPGPCWVNVAKRTSLNEPWEIE